MMSPVQAAVEGLYHQAKKKSPAPVKLDAINKNADEVSKEFRFVMEHEAKSGDPKEDATTNLGEKDG